MSSEEEVTPYLPQPGDVFAFDACTWLMLAATPTHALCIDINDDSTHATLPLDRLTGRAVNDGATYFRERAARLEHAAAARLRVDLRAFDHDVAVRLHDELLALERHRAVFLERRLELGDFVGVGGQRLFIVGNRFDPLATGHHINRHNFSGKTPIQNRRFGA